MHMHISLRKKGKKEKENQVRVCLSLCCKGCTYAFGALGCEPVQASVLHATMALEELTEEQAALMSRAIENAISMEELHALEQAFIDGDLGLFERATLSGASGTPAQSVGAEAQAEHEAPAAAPSTGRASSSTDTRTVSPHPFIGQRVEIWREGRFRQGPRHAWFRGSVHEVREDIDARTGAGSTFFLVVYDSGEQAWHELSVFGRPSRMRFIRPHEEHNGGGDTGRDQRWEGALGDARAEHPRQAGDGGEGDDDDNDSSECGEYDDEIGEEEEE
jgi:hypothetical protein